MHWILLGALALLVYGYVTRNTSPCHPANTTINKTPIGVANSVNTSGCRAPVSTIAAGVCEPQCNNINVGSIPLAGVHSCGGAPVTAQFNTPGQRYTIWPGPTLGGYITPPSGVRLVGNKDNGAVYQMQGGQLYYRGLTWQQITTLIGLPLTQGGSWIKYVWWTSFNPHPPFAVVNGPDAGKS